MLVSININCIFRMFLITITFKTFENIQLIFMGPKEIVIIDATGCNPQK
jgi:hypothetical protein